MALIAGSPVIKSEWLLDGEVARSSYTVLVKFPSSMIASLGNNVQIAVMGPAAGGTLSACYISNVATTGNAYDADTTPTAITWNTGSASLTMSAYTEYSSDVIAFPFQAKSFIIGFNVGATTNATRGVLRGVTTYYKAALAQADDTTRSTGYSYSRNTINFLTQITVTS